MCVDNALEVLYKTWLNIENKSAFSAVTGLCVNEHGNIVGDRFPTDPFDSNSLDNYFIYNLKGEKWGFQKTSVMKEFPFPQLPNEKLIPESVVWRQIARKYQTRYINQPLRIYEQQVDSYSRQSSWKHALGFAYAHKLTLMNYFDYFKYSKLSFIKSAIQYVRFSLHSKNEIFHSISGYPKLLVILSLPIGALFYLKDNLSKN